MKATRTRARIVGGLFIGAAVFSILGLYLEGPALNNPDYILQGPTSKFQIALGVYLELIAVATMVGTGIAFFPLFREYNESLALGYAGFRLFEAVLVVIGAVSVLTLLGLRQAYESGAGLDGPTLETAGYLLRSLHDWVFMLGPNFMLGINTSMAAYVLYRTRLVPRKIATLGLVGAVCISIAAVLNLFGLIGQFSVYGAVLALPIFSYEMSLAVWLIWKGFNESASMQTPGTTNAPAASVRQD